VKRSCWLQGGVPVAAWPAAWPFALVIGVCFVGVMYPYIINSKRVFGSYFYHGTTSILTWYDAVGESLVAVLPHLQPDGRIGVPREQLASAGKYWRTHTVAQIAGRLRDGFTDIVVRSYTTHWHFKYVLLYLAFAAAVAAANRRAFVELLQRDAALVVFLIAYAAAFLTFTAFFSIVSGTGTTRFVLTHVAPLLYLLSRLLVRAPFSATRWTLAGVEITPVHIHGLIAATVSLDIAFTIWPRLMTTYSGF
jgi:hypothetical protein